MVVGISIFAILIISFLLALRSAEHELSTPKEVTNLRISKREGISGVILFLKEKIVHYSSNSS